MSCCSLLLGQVLISQSITVLSPCHDRLVLVAHEALPVRKVRLEPRGRLVRGVLPVKQALPVPRVLRALPVPEAPRVLEEAAEPAVPPVLEVPPAPRVTRVRLDCPTVHLKSRRNGSVSAHYSHATLSRRVAPRIASLSAVAVRS